MKREPSLLPVLLVGLAVVTVALGLLAFYLASGARRDAAELAAANQTLVAVQAQATAEALRSAQAAAALATAQADAAAAQSQGEAFKRIVRANQLVNNATLALETRPQAALLLAVEAIRVQREASEAPLPEVVQRLRSVLGVTGGQPLPTGDAVTQALARSDDGRWLAAGDEAGALRLWDLDALDQPPRLLAGHSGPVWALAFAPDSSALISAGDDATVRVWPLTPAAAASSAGAGQGLAEQPVVLRAGGGPVFALAVQPGGSRLAGGGQDGVVRLWDLAALDAPALPLAGPAGVVNALAFAPDGATLAAAGSDRTVALWDPASGTQLATLDAPPGDLTALAFDPAGRHLAAGAADSTVLLWQAVLPGDAAPPGDADLPGAAVSPGDAALPGTAQPGFNPTPRLLVGHEYGVYAIRFSPDGAWLASGDENGAVRLWRVPGSEPGSAESYLLGRHQGNVRGLAFVATAAGPALASSGYDGQVRLWNYLNREAAPLVLRGHDGAINQLVALPAAGDAAAPAGAPGAETGGEYARRFVTAGFDHTLRLWETTQPFAEPDQVMLAGQPVGKVVVTPDGGRIIASLVDEPLIQVWDAAGAFLVQRLLAGDVPAAAVPEAAAPEGGISDDTVPEGELPSNAGPSNAGPSGAGPSGAGPEGEAVASLALSPDGRWLWAGGRGGSVWGWQTDVLTATGPAPDSLAPTSLAPAVHLADHSGAVNALALSPTGRSLATAGDDGLLLVYDLPNAGGLPSVERTRTFDAGIGPLTGVSFSPDGALLAASGQEGSLRLWDVATGEPRHLLQGPDLGLLDLALQPDGPWIVGAGADGTVWVWNADALDFDPAELRRHRNEINAVNFSADGTLLASAGADAAVYLWSTAQPAAEPDALRGHSASVNGVAFAPDNAWVVTTSSDGTLRRWALSVDALVEEACRTAGRNLSFDEWEEYFALDLSRYRKTCAWLPGPTDASANGPTAPADARP